jgi:hypothetical protein
MYNITDGGKTKDGFHHEHNDCAVRAVAIACEIPYKEAHAKLKAHGRKDRGTTYNFVGFVAKKIKTQKKLKPTKGKASLGTLATFLKNNPKGTYIACKRGHAFAVVDGVVNDSWKVKMGSHIKFAWKVK